MTKVKIEKNYSRKLSLKEIIGRFDNIECGTSISFEFNANDEESLNKALRVLGKKVVKETERELAEVLAYLVELSKDPANNALLASGDLVSVYSRKSSKVDGMDDILASSGIIEVKEEKEND